MEQYPPPDPRGAELTAKMFGSIRVLPRATTTVRLYDVPTYDHIETVLDGRRIGMVVDREVLDEMAKRHYPCMRMDIQDDPKGKEWIETQELKEITALGQITLDHIIGDIE